MTELAAARLIRLMDGPASGKNGPKTYVVDTSVKKPEFEVQFNPTTLKISRSNNIDKGGSTTNTQKRQAFAAQPATLSFELEFDTAEESKPSGEPKDVRDYTRIVRQFIEPTPKKPKDPPPAIRFHWGSFIFQGIVTQLTEDLDFFASNGTPLRAKVSVTITEQNPEWDGNKVGNGARDAAKAARAERTSSGNGAGGATTPSAPSGNGPGTPPSPNPVSTALAQAGESVQQLLSRLNEDPATWRSAMAGLDSPLSLTAGTQVQLGATAAASASAGLGASAGFAAGAGVTGSAGFSATAGLSASAGVDAGMTRSALGVDGDASLGRGAAAEATAGFVLAEAGGIARASARVQADAAASAQASARASFAAPAVSATARSRAPAQADARSLTYGRGVPLRARVYGDAAATPGG